VQKKQYASWFDDLIKDKPAPSGVNDFFHIQCAVLRGVGAEAHSTCLGRMQLPLIVNGKCLGSINSGSPR
jgi:hypothetical protein